MSARSSNLIPLYLSMTFNFQNQWAMREPLRILILLFWMSVSAKNEKELDFGEVLVDGQKVHLYLIKGTLEPANWSYFELKWTGPFRLILDSLAGDADVYVSTRKVIIILHTAVWTLLQPCCCLRVIWKCYDHNFRISFPRVCTLRNWESWHSFFILFRNTPVFVLMNMKCYLQHAVSMFLTCHSHWKDQFTLV